MSLRLARDASLLLGAQVFYKASSLILTAALARLLPAADIGLFFFALAFAQAFLLLANGNVGPLVMRRIAREPGRAREQLQGVVGLRLVTGPLMLLAVSAGALVLQPRLWPGVLPVALFLLLEDLYLAFGAVFLAQERARANVAIGVPVQAVHVAIAAAAVWALPHWTTLVAANVVRAALLAGIGWIVAGRPSARRVPGFLDGALPFMMLAAFALVTDQLDTLVLGTAATYDAVARFRLAVLVVTASTFVPVGVGSVLYASLAAGRDPALFRRALALLVGAGTLGAAVLAAFAFPIASLLYGGLAPGIAPLLRLLAPLVPLLFAQMFLRATLQARGREHGVLVAAGVGGAVSLVTILAFVPAHGAAGAAAARLCSAAVQTATLAWLYLRTSEPTPTQT